jgi:transposase InsO family protein
VAVGNVDRLLLVGLYRFSPKVLDALKILKPETVLHWHRAGFRAYWRWKSRSCGGRPKTSVDIRLLIREMSVYSAYGGAFIRRLRAMGIRDRPISARSPWQNGYAERLIGSIRRDCLDHVVVFGEQHLRHLLSSYQRYYNVSGL